mgnify:CR=1 FL=1|jgi:DNA-binding transcriptional LysR family regulator
MEIKNVKTFIKVAELENFTRAAQDLGYAQSTVTMQIQQLEQELQTQLFERNGKLISLSSAGKEFLQYAYQIVKYESMALEHFLFEEEPKGKLSIGVMETVCASSYSQLFYDFLSRHPKVSLKLLVSTTFEALELLEKGKLDLIFLLDNKVHHQDWKTAREFPAEISFFCASDHPLAQLGEVSLDRLLEETFIMTERECNYRHVFENDLAAMGKSLRCSMEIGHTEFIIDAVLNQLGIGLLPSFTLKKELEKGRISLIQVKDYHLTMWVQVIYNQNRFLSPALKVFIKELDKTLDV